MPKILFVASLHHPEELQREQAQNPAQLFPSSMAQHFYERALLRAGYTLQVFWRNVSGFGKAGDIHGVQSTRYSNHITPRRALEAVMRRLPPHLNADYRIRNQRLLEQAQRFAPDIVWLVGDNTVIAPATLATLRAGGARIVYTCGTSPIAFSHPVERAAARLYDWVLANDYYHGIQWQELGAKNMLCLPVAAIDPDFHHPRPLDEATRKAYTCDVSFVGTLVPHNLYSERVQALEALAGVDVGIWTTHDVPASLRRFVRGQALGDSMMNVISAARIALNTHGDFMRYGGNMRLFECAGAGVFQMVDNRPAVREWFTVGEHVAVYHDTRDLQEQVAYYLAHPQERQRMAEACLAHVRTHHTYDKRVATLQATGVL